MGKIIYESEDEKIFCDISEEETLLVKLKSKNMELDWTLCDILPPPLRKNVLLIFKNGDVAEGQRNVDGTYTQYRWDCVRNDAIYWSEMPKVEFN